MKKPALLILFAFIMSANANAGGIVSNGGHTILCGTGGNPIYYTDDYLATLEAPAGADRELALIASWNDSASRIEQVLSRYLPELNQSFSNFRQFAFYKPDGKEISGQVRWWAGINGPIDWVGSEEETKSPFIPENCFLTLNVEGLPVRVIESAQTIVRTELLNVGGNELVLYRFSPVIMAHMDPMQTSFLLVHEWLWDHTNDFAIIRRVNRFIHTKKFGRMNRTQLLSELRERGLKI